MENLEQKIIDACPVGFKPKIWVRYMDNIFEVVKRDKVQELIDNLNSAEETENLKFTVEVESEKKLPWQQLRMEPSRQRYTGRVPTQTNILNFNSHHPLNHKVGVARILLYRKENIASEDMDKTKEEKHIYSALFLNNYPK